MVHKYIRTVFLLDEAETFLVVKPFDSSICHSRNLLSKYFNLPDWRMPLVQNGIFLQRVLDPAIYGGMYEADLD